MVDQVELLPCPFCGDAMEIYEGLVGHAIDADEICPLAYAAIDVDRWNRRTPTTPERSDD